MINPTRLKQLKVASDAEEAEESDVSSLAKSPTFKETKVKSSAVGSRCCILANLFISFLLLNSW